MGSERVVDVAVRRHVFDSERPFLDVLDAIFGGISQPDIEALFGKLAGEHLIRAVQLHWSGRRRAALGLMRFMAARPRPCAGHVRSRRPGIEAGRRLVRLIAGQSRSPWAR